MDIKGRIKERDYRHGIRTISKFALVREFHWEGFSEDVLKDLYRKEISFLSKIEAKKTVPNFIMNLLVSNLAEVLEGRRSFRGPKKGTSQYEEYFNALRPLANYTFDKDSSKEFKKKLSSSDLESILENPIYDMDLRKLIYLSQGNIKKDFSEYFWSGLNKRPYSLLSRSEDYNLILQFLYLVEHFKIHLELNKNSSYPPKRIEILETIQAYRDNKDSQNKIYGQIQKILDPDYGLNF